MYVKLNDIDKFIYHGGEMLLVLMVIKFVGVYSNPYPSPLCIKQMVMIYRPTPNEVYYIG